jgi:hypothetical protein
MLDWLADELLGAGAAVAGWFVDKDSSSFPVIEMMVATLVLAAVVYLIVCWQSLAEHWRWLRRACGMRRSS